MTRTYDSADLTAAEVTAKLLEGPYSVEKVVGTATWAHVLGPDGTYFKDRQGRDISFHLVDAEKIVRLYNLDAHLAKK